MENKVKGLIYGAIIADIVAKPYRNKDYSSGYRVTPKDIDFTEKDWSSVSDMLILVLQTITESMEYINCFRLANLLKEWQEKGIIDLPQKEKYIGMQLNFILNQKSYLNNPIQSSKNSYKRTGAESAMNDALFSNAVCGLLRNWHKNTILHTVITTYDSRCVVSCIIQSYIINCIFYGKQINWQYLNPICQKIIVTHKIQKTQNLLEYNKHWHLALNYKNYIKNHMDDDESYYLSFLKKLNIGNYSNNDTQNYVMIGFVLSIVIVIDIQHQLECGHTVNGDYYKKIIQETASCGGDSVANCSIVGAIIGVMIGCNKLPLDWLKKIPHKDWLEYKIKPFISKIQKQL